MSKPTGNASILESKNYKTLRVIGRGAFGLCFLCRKMDDKLNKKVVIKFVSCECRSEKEKRDILYEAEVLSQLKHPNIIRFSSHFEVEESIYIVMEYADGDFSIKKVNFLGGTLDSMIQERNNKRISQHLVIYYFTQISLALNYIHSKKILHRDLKTQNIFLNRKRTIVKVGDFGISKELSTKNQASTVIGTPNYLSPELCASIKAIFVRFLDRGYGIKSDIWSMGCVLYELVELHKAFEGHSFAQIVIKISSGKNRPFAPGVSPEMENFILQMLQLDENERPTTEGRQHLMKN